MNVGCYVLDLYCDNEAAHLFDGQVNYDLAGGSAHFTHETGSGARSKARKRGWRIGRERDLCPACTGRRNP